MTNSWDDTATAPAVEGRDPTGTVTVSRVGDAVEVRVRELTEADRDPTWLGAAVLAAWDDAALRRLEADAAASPDAAELRDLGTAFVEGRRPLATAPPEWMSDLTAGRASALDRVDPAAATRLAAPPRRGRSRDGDVRTVFTGAGRPSSMTIDPDWLARASVATVARALTDALTPDGDHR